MEAKTMTLRDTIVPKSDQLNYDDFLTGPKTCRVTGLKMGTPDQPVIVEVVNVATETPERPYKPCKGMRRVLIKVWGDKGKEWLGKRLTLRGEPSVKFGGVEVGGIVVSHVSGISAPVSVLLTTARSKRAEYTVQPLPELAAAESKGEG